MKIITINNSKGGVAKSTSSQAIAAILNQKGKKTLIIDCDQQRNTSSTYNAIDIGRTNMFDVFSERCTLKEAIRHTDNGDIVVSDKHLDSANSWIKDNKDGIFFLKKQLETVANEYDFVIIDTNMYRDLILDSTLVAADEIIIPTDEDYYSLQGFMQLYSHIEDLEKAHNIKIKIGGILLVMYTPRTNAWRAQEQYLETICSSEVPTKIYKSRIPRGTVVKDAHQKSQNIAEFGSKTKVSLAYQNLVDEILQEN